MATTPDTKMPPGSVTSTAAPAPPPATVPESTATDTPNAPLAKKRLASLDQFRGYTVAGMFLVNYMGSYAVCPAILKHHNVNCSYADTIMPHFLFAVGFAFRLTFGRRAQAEGLKSAYFRMVRRFLGLMLVAMSVYHVGRIANSWEQLSQMSFWEIFESPMKREWLQTLGHIAITSLWVLPVIRAGWGVRITYMVLSGIAHQVACYFGYFEYANTSPAGIDGGPLGFLTWTIPTILGTLVCDAIIAPKHGKPALWKMTFASFAIMGLGYLFSCGMSFYELSPEELAARKEEIRQREDKVKVINEQIKALNEEAKPYRKTIGDLEDKNVEVTRTEMIALADEISQQPEYQTMYGKRRVPDAAEARFEPSEELVALRAEIEEAKAAPRLVEIDEEIKALQEQIEEVRTPDLKLAPNPVIPTKEQIAQVDFKSFFVEWPFIRPMEDDPRTSAPPHIDHFEWNAWMMSQRAGTIAYLTFAGGLSILVYVIFYIVCDIWGFQLGLFRTFGTNALACYVIYGLVAGAVKQFSVRDGVWWYSWGLFLVFFAWIYLFIRVLEKHKIYIRL